MRSPHLFLFVLLAMAFTGCASTSPQAARAAKPKQQTGQVSDAEYEVRAWRSAEAFALGAD